MLVLPQGKGTPLALGTRDHTPSRSLDSHHHGVRKQPQHSYTVTASLKPFLTFQSHGYKVNHDLHLLYSALICLSIWQECWKSYATI